MSLDIETALADVREWLDSAASASHQRFPVLDSDGLLVGAVTRRDLLSGPDIELDVLRRVRDATRRAPAVVYGDSTLRDAVDLMITQGVGRLPLWSARTRGGSPASIRLAISVPRTPPGSPHATVRGWLTRWRLSCRRHVL